MSTKDYYLSDKADIIYNEPLNDSYSNLNLNHNNQSFHIDNVTSKNATNNTKKFKTMVLNYRLQSFFLKVFTE